jgi:hypothetical protein
MGLKRILADALVPQLLNIVRNSDIPVTLRSSALSILSVAIETAPMALLPYIYTLADACLTLLSLESRPLKRRRDESQAEDDDGDDAESLGPIRTEAELKSARKLIGYDESEEPLSTDPKHPSFRRSAILFIALLLRSTAVAEEDNTSTSGMLVSPEIVERTRVVLGYVGSTDEDGLVRFQAGQVLDELGSETG